MKPSTLLCRAISHLSRGTSRKRSLNRANNNCDVPRSVSFDNAVDLVDRVDGSTKKVRGMRSPSANATFEISRVAPIMDLYVMVAGNILELDPIGPVIRPHESVIGSRWNWRLVSFITSMGIFHRVTREGVGGLVARNSDCSGHTVPGGRIRSVPNRDCYFQAQRINQIGRIVMNISVEVCSAVHKFNRILAQEATSFGVVVSGAVVVEGGFGVNLAPRVEVPVRGGVEPGVYPAEGVKGEGVHQVPVRVGVGGDGSHPVSLGKNRPRRALLHQRLVDPQPLREAHLGASRGGQLGNLIVPVVRINCRPRGRGDFFDPPPKGVVGKIQCSARPRPAGAE